MMQPLIRQMVRAKYSRQSRRSGHIACTAVGIPQKKSGCARLSPVASIRTGWGPARDENGKERGKNRFNPKIMRQSAGKLRQNRPETV